MLNKIKLTTIPATHAAQAAFAENSTEQQQRDFINMFAKMYAKAPKKNNCGGLVFSISAAKLNRVIAMLKIVTSKEVESHEHNDQLDVTCDLVHNKYRVIIRHDYSDYKIATVELYTFKK